MKYDEGTMLTGYLWDRCQSLMTDSERRMAQVAAAKNNLGDPA